MCGIAGTFIKPNPVSVQKMVAAMPHRGPDDAGVFSDDVCTLGHARLAIVDTTTGGHQPMASASGLIHIVFNGEMYNYKAEKDLLVAKGHCFHTSSDTEVVLKLYEEYGESFVARLRGIFAFAIYDRRSGIGKESLFLARDQFGIKPLLYTQQNGSFIFTSELKPLLASGLVPRNVNSNSLRQLLSLGSVYQPATLVEGVFALPSAHTMRVDHGGVRIERYWSYEQNRVHGLRSLPYAEQVDCFGQVMKESVKLQMIADVPVGAFLSGGVDSSLIVALMTREAVGDVKTFSVGFEEGANATDESHEAAVIARLLGTNHSRVMITADDMVNHLDRFIQGIDQPSVDGLNSYFVSHAAAQNVKVSLSGTGGDELFLGYPWFAAVKAEIERMPKLREDASIRKMLSRVLMLGGHIQANAKKFAADDSFREAYTRQYHCFGSRRAFDLVAKERRFDMHPVTLSDDIALCDEMPHAQTLERASVLCLNGYTRNQLLRDIDACSMAHSLEVRVPFLDVQVADFAFSLPSKSKLLIGERTLDPSASYSESGVKRIVCDFAKRYLPADFFEARAKKGFSLPYADWLKGPLASILADTLSEKSVVSAGLFDPKAVSKVYRDFHAGECPWSHPWLLMVIELWRRRVLEAQ